MKTKKLHTNGKDVNDQQDVCGECFSWVDNEDDYCWNCGSEFVEDIAYSKEDLTEKD